MDDLTVCDLSIYLPIMSKPCWGLRHVRDKLHKNISKALTVKTKKGGWNQYKKISKVCVRIAQSYSLAATLLML